MSSTAALRCPENHQNLGTVMSNCFHEIERDLAAQIQAGPYCGSYPGWNFFCPAVWWDEPAKLWHAEVWVYRSYIETISGATLEEIMEKVSDKYGHD